MTGFDIIGLFLSESLNLCTAGSWIQNNLSLEGLIALPALFATLLIALAIYNFEDSKSGSVIDIAAIMKHVVSVPRILLSFTLVSLLVVFYKINQSLEWVIPLLFIAYIAGVLILVQSLINSYRWARSIETGNRQNIRTIVRLKYLGSLDDSEIIPVWSSVWRGGEQNKKLMYQHELIKPFLDDVVRTKNLGNYESTVIVSNFISSIDTVDLTNPATIDTISNFYIKEFRKDKKKEARTDRGMGYIVYTNSVKKLFISIVDKTLLKDDSSLALLIDSAREQLRRQKVDEHIFITNIMDLVLDRIKDRNEVDWILESIPDEWMITTKNLDNENTKQNTLAMLNSYSRMLSRSNLYVGEEGDEKINMPLQKITAELLPKADPMLWARLFAFHFSPYVSREGESHPEARIRSYVNNNPSFGFMSHIHTGFYDAEKGKVIYEDAAREEEEVIKLAAKTTLFRDFHNQETMDKYLNSIDTVKQEYAEDETKLNKLLYLETNLRKIQQKLTNKDTGR